MFRPLSNLARALCLATLSSLCLSASAAVLEVPELAAAPELDGRLSEEAWASAAVVVVPLEEVGLLPSLGPPANAQFSLVRYRGSLILGVQVTAAYQLQHALDLVLAKPGEREGHGRPLSRISLRPWNPEALPTAVALPAPGEGRWAGASELGQPELDDAVVMVAAFAEEGYAAGWQAEVVVDLARVAGVEGTSGDESQRELGLAFLVQSELGRTAAPEGAGVLFTGVPSEVGVYRMHATAGSDPAFDAQLAELRRRRTRIVQAQRELQMLHQILDVQGMARVACELADLQAPSPAARLRCARHRAASGDPRGRLEILEALRAECPGFAELPSPEVVAHDMLEAHRWDRARELLLQLPETNLRRRIDLGMLAYHLGNFSEGRERLARLLEAEDVPADRALLIRRFHDFCAAYEDRLLAVEQRHREADEAGEPLPRVAIHLEGDETRVIELELFENDAPNTVAAFLTRVAEGYYDGQAFHRIVASALVQTGCPLTKNEHPRDDGAGGPGYHLPPEIHDRPHLRGAVGMAHEGKPGTEGSQFYLCVSTCAHLNGSHTVFGRVVQGMQHVDAIQVGTRVERIEVLAKRDHPYEFRRVE